MKLTTSLSLFAISASLFCLSAQAGKMDPSTLPPASEKTGLTFGKDIGPLFQQSCCECHGAKKQKAKLRLDSLDSVLKGSDEGAVVVPGQSGKSKVVYIVVPSGKKPAVMPPAGKGKPLTTEQVGLLRAWIDQGAK